MTNEEQIKALAELDGWNFVRVEKGKYTQAGCLVWQNGVERGGFDDSQKMEYAMRIFGIPNYLTSYDAIIPLIQKQSNEIISRVAITLGAKHDWCSILKASPAQLCEELLRATGK